MAKQTTAADFKNELAKFAENFRREIEATVEGFDPDKVASAARVERARTDFIFFARTYFPHYLRDSDKIGLSNFQAWFCEAIPEMIQDERSVSYAIAAPRGEAKSTYLLIFYIWAAVFKKKRYMLNIMDSYDQSAVVVEAFKAEMETNPRLAMDYPKATGPGRLWREGEAVTSNDVKLHAKGAGQKIRGLKHGAYRPDFIGLDDIENDENVRSPEQRNKLSSWLAKAVDNLGEAGAKMDIVFVGTMLHYDSVLARTQKSPTWRKKLFKSILRMPDNMDLWDEWQEILINDGVALADSFYRDNKVAMDAGAIVSWPDKRPLILLMTKRAGNRNAFNSELQNSPTDQDGSFSDIVFWVQEPHGRTFFASCDPSLGKRGRKGDPSAILVGAFDRSNIQMDIVYASIKRRTPSTIIGEIISIQRQFGCAMWFFESVQFQEFLRQQLITEAGKKGVNLPAQPVIPNVDKDLRIESLSIPIHDGRIRLHASQTVLIQQLEQWPKSDHDDGPDALEMLWTGAISSVSLGDVAVGSARTFGGGLDGLRGDGASTTGILGSLGRM